MRRRYMIPRYNEPIVEEFNYDAYLTMEAIDDTFSVKFSSDLEYNIDGTEWISLPANTDSPAIDAGHKMSFRKTFASDQGTSVGKFTFTKRCNLSGNCNSIIFGDNALSNWSLNRYNYVYDSMFKDCAVVNISEEFLPIQTLAPYCYRYMFQNCTYLKNTPKLFASVLPSYCYSYMFYGCTSLNYAYDLLTTSADQYSCEYMFYGCTSLTDMPKIEATTLSNHCYRYMFQNCTSLKNVQPLPAMTLSNYCYYGMFYGCTSLTTAPELPAKTLATYCYYSMFYGCTSLTTVPELPAKTLKTYCYRSMFNGCTSLTTAPELPATILQSYCYYSMFSGCTSLITAPELPATALATYCYSGMFDGCSSLTTAPELPATTLATYCYYQMFSGCTSLNKAPSILPAEAMKDYSCYYMFNGCTSLTTAPELPAKTLATDCYRAMFSNCTKLNYVKALFLDAPSTNYTNSWLYNVSKTGTFVKASDATWEDTFGISAIPTGWNVLVDGFEKNYLTIEALEDDFYIEFLENEFNPTYNPSYSLDGIEWHEFGDDGIMNHVVNAGEMIYIKGNLDSNLNVQVGSLFTDKRFNLSGNCMSLIFGDNASEHTDLTGYDSCFSSLFNDNYGLENISADFLPATTLATGCYQSMFLNCTSLTTAPELPATELAPYCYQNMFYDCTSLTTANPFTGINSTNPCTPQNNCCEYMFYGCTSLTSASTPYFVEGELGGNYMTNMFANCTSLNSIYALFPASFVPDDTQNWVTNVAPNGTLYVLNAETWNSDDKFVGDNAKPQNWTLTQYNENTEG